MPLIDKDIILDQDYEKIERASFDDIVQFIVKDCNEAIAEPNLPFRTKFATEQGRMTKAVAHFIKASALLFDASPLWNPDDDVRKWQTAAAAAKEAVAALESNGYELYPKYEEYFITRPDKCLT